MKIFKQQDGLIISSKRIYFYCDYDLYVNGIELLPSIAIRRIFNGKWYLQIKWLNILINLG